MSMLLCRYVASVNQALGFGEGMFLFLPLAFFDSVQRDGNNLFDVKNYDARI